MELVPVARAAHVLGVTTRTVRGYRQRGVLRGRPGGVSPGDVLDLLRDRGAQVRVRLDRRAARVALASTDGLEAVLGEAIKALDLSRSMELSTEQLVTFYQTAQHFLVHGCPPDTMSLWASVFLGLNERGLTHLRRATKDRHPWTTFLHLFERIATDLTAACGVMVSRAIEAHLVLLAREWLQLVEGPRHLHRQVRVAGGTANRKLVRELRQRQRDLRQ